MGRHVPKRRRCGQGMTEYVVILGLIAILLIGVIAKFRDQLDASYRKASGAVATHVTGPMGGKGGKGAMSSSSSSMGGSSDPLSDPSTDPTAPKPNNAGKPTSNLKPNQ